MGDDFPMDDENERWHQYRNVMGIPSRRRMFCGIGWIVCVLSLIVIAFVFMAVKANAAVKETIKVNVTIHASSQQLYKLFPSALNSSIDPCVDFYKFSCDSWSQNNPIPPYDARITTFSVLQDIVNKKKKSIFETTRLNKDLPSIVNNAVRFYDSCVEQDSKKYYNSKHLLSHYFSQIGGWPILNHNEWNETMFDWKHASAYLIKTLDLHTVIGVYTIDDDKSDGRNAIYLRSPSILEDEKHVLRDVSSFEMLYVILNVLNGSNLNSNVTNDIERLATVESKFRKLLSSPKKVSDPVYITIEELSNKIPDVDWLKYLQLITNDTLLEINETLVMNDTVVTDNFDYLNNVAKVLSSNTFSKMELANLFGWFVVKDIWILIPEVLVKYAEFNQYPLYDVKNAACNQCYDLVLEVFSQSLDYLYVKNSPLVEIKTDSILTSYLKSALKDIIEKNHWLDYKTKISILSRLHSMQHVIGYQDYMNNKTEFDKMYKDFPSMTDNILQYYFNIEQYYVKMRTLILKKPTNYTKWILPRSVSDASAYFMVNRNTLVYPISLHNPPFYYFNGPWYLNFGAIGSVIGHEMMHGFDNYGSQGNDLNVTWMSEPSKKNYQELADCFKHQYSNFDSTGFYKNNGICTLRENIADNEGLHIAYEAYKKHVKDFGGEEHYQTLNNFTSDQMFFIAYASIWCSEISPSLRKSVQKGTHSFPELRVNGAVSNSKSFAAAFSCSEGSPMNPLKKCFLW